MNDVMFLLYEAISSMKCSCKNCANKHTSECINNCTEFFSGWKWEHEEKLKEVCKKCQRTNV